MRVNVGSGVVFWPMFGNVTLVNIVFGVCYGLCLYFTTAEKLAGGNSLSLQGGGANSKGITSTNATGDYIK